MKGIALSCSQGFKYVGILFLKRTALGALAVPTSSREVCPGAVWVKENTIKPPLICCTFRQV